MMPTKLIVGLSTPGIPGYHNRHSVGFQCLDLYARRHSIEWWRAEHLRAEIGASDRAGVSQLVVVAKPLTHMNSSGAAVGDLVRHFQIDLGDILVIHDDLDLPVGRLRMKASGSSGGQNGVRSIIEQFKSESFARLKIGIGRPPKGTNVVEYIMERFTSDEEQIMSPLRDRACEILDYWVIRGTDATMNLYNN